MATTHYGDETAVRTWLKSFNDEEQLTDELLEEALNSADDFINSEIAENSLPSTVPKMISRAATYWATMEILDAFYNTEEDRSPTAVKYERRARELVARYILENPVMKEEKVYSGSHTPCGDDFRQSDSGYVDPDRW
ncbi:hypothetical protein [uncultured Methanobacterium sp.]|uniref:hypothetical protein n=1 Tax=uncultured Methanobacterium sp. TaxID=176306 RepID=UPI002AA72159|nr:hypothetical protein [uncultured Methanobacterium sp.]